MSMIQVTMIRNRDGKYIGFDCIGHAGYAGSGEDIVCAGVSVLVINTVNSIRSYTNEIFSADTDEDAGKITLRFEKPAGHDAQLLMQSLVLGLQGVYSQYGARYMKLNFKEG